MTFEEWVSRNYSAIDDTWVLAMMQRSWNASREDTASVSKPDNSQVIAVSDALKQRGLDDHLRRINRPDGWKGDPDIEPDNSDAELGAYVRRLVQELSDSPKSFLYQVQRAISDQSQANSQAVALSDQQIYDKFSFLEGVVNERNYRRIAETAIEIQRAALSATANKGPK